MEHNDIFISYRNSENRQKAEHLYTLLDRRFPWQVSYEKESFTCGGWDEQILRRIDHCKDVIVLLTPETFSYAKEMDAAKYERWAQMSGEEVLREIEADPEADILRTEISRAIAHGKNIVPVVHTPNGIKFSDLNFPSDIAALTRFEGVLYNDDDPNLFLTSLIPMIIRLLKTKRRRWWMLSYPKDFSSVKKKQENLIDNYLPKKVEFDIFISYRRVDGREHARNIQLALKGHGYKHIFFDYDSIQKGEFNKRIIDAIYSCTDFILVLSPKSMKRCTKNGDPVANEIRTAVKYKKNIIPVTIDGKEVKWPRIIPDDLKFIKGLQFHDHKSDSYFDHSIDELCEKLTYKIEQL